MKNRIEDDNSQSGFTIVELMIATMVLALILLMSTVIMIGIGNLYYKGVNQANVQDDTRAIVDDLVQHLRFDNTAQVPGGPILEGGQNVYVMCIDQTRYTYILGMPIGSPLSHVLWRDTLGTGKPCAQANLLAADPASTNGGIAGTGTELIAPGSRLTQFTVTSSSPYVINVGVAYGAISLTGGVATGANVTCQGSTGDRFCATSYLSATVDKRDS